MAESIINKLTKNLNQGLASLYDRDEIVDLENEYANQYGIENSASGALSDARHMAAMNNLSNSLSPMNNSVGNFIGDVGAFGAGLVNEVPAALTRGFNKENYGEIMEDIAANARGTFGTPNTTTAQQIYDSVFSKGVPTQTASNIGNYGTAQAAEVNPNQATNIGTAPGIFDINEVGDPALNPNSVNVFGLDPYGVNEDLRDLGNPTGDPRVVSEELGLSGGFVPTNPNMRDIAGNINLNMTDLGNPLGDSRVVSEEQGLVGGIPDRDRGMAEPGAPTGAYEMIGGTPVAIGDVLGKQMALEKSNLMDEPVNQKTFGIQNLLGPMFTLAGFPTIGKSISAYNIGKSLKSGALGKRVNSIGIGSLGSRFAGKMRGINPITGKPNTQAQYEANREAARTQNRIDNMLDRKAKGKNYSEKNLKDLIGQQIADRKDKSGSGKKSGFTNPGINSYGPHKGSGSSDGPSKIVCTMMNERYGFGSFRNKIWMKFHESHGPEYQKGYHAIFLPLVKIAKGEGKINTAVRKVLEHMGRHVTADMFKIMKGKKRDTLGRIYRAIFEPACHIIGKIKSALGRG